MPTAQTRPAAVAGLFYPAAPQDLDAAVTALLAQAGKGAQQSRPKAIIVPHAGYIYSGEIAARGYALLRGGATSIRRIVLLGPTHRKYIRGLAAPNAARFDTPLGPVTVDQDAIRGLHDLPQVILDDEAHAQEHSLEVQLPFLRRIAPRAAVVPLAVGDVTPRDVAAVIARLWGGDETLFVISSDLSHFLPYADARATDEATARLIETFAGAEIGPAQACGCFAIAGMLEAAKAHGLSVRRLDLRNSGDTAGPRDQVVGYGAWALDQTTRDQAVP
jgi:AmmeMemoRadiSam system protein B